MCSRSLRRASSLGVVQAVPAARAPALGQQAELLVVAHGARGRARAAGELSDAKLLLS